MATQRVTPQTPPAAIFRGASETEITSAMKPRTFRGYDAGDVHEEAGERRMWRSELRRSIFEDANERRWL